MGRRAEYRAWLISALVLSLAGLAGAQPAGTASADAATSATPSTPVSGPATPWVDLPPVAVTIGDAQVEMGRRLRLTLKLREPDKLWRRMHSVAAALSPAEPSPCSTQTSGPIDLLLHWQDPLLGERILPFSGDSVEVDIPAGSSRTATYYLSWKDPAGEFELFRPAQPGCFEVDLIPLQAITVVSGPGSEAGVFFGGRIPIRLSLWSPAGVAEATLHHRSSASAPFTSAAMSRVESSPLEEVWSAELPRPAGLNASVEYYVRLRDAAGQASVYGSARRPYRLHLLDPVSEP